MKTETQNKFAEILAQAQAKAAKKTVLNSTVSQTTALTVEDVINDQLRPTEPEPQPEPTPAIKVQPEPVTEQTSTTTKEQANFEQAEVKAGQVQIIDYSEKAFAVIGDTKRIQPLLESLHGKFNRYLSCGPGFIFSKKRLAAVTKALSAPIIPNPETVEAEAQEAEAREAVKLQGYLFAQEPATFNYVG